MRVEDDVAFLVLVQRSLDRALLLGMVLARLDLLRRGSRDVVAVKEAAELVLDRLEPVARVANSINVGLRR